MTDISDHITDYNNKIKDLIHDDIKSCGNKYSKIQFFNNDIKIPMQKIWLLLPKMRLYNQPVIWKSDKPSSVKIQLIIHPEMIAIIDFMKDLEERIFKTVKTMPSNINNNNLTYESSIMNIDSAKCYSTLCFQIPYECENEQHIYQLPIFNNQNKLDQSIDLVSGMFIAACIELSDVWISAIKLGFNWKVLQMKAYPEFDFSKCLFDIDNIPPPAPMLILPKPKHNTDRHSPKKPELFVPNVSDLIKMKQLLKPCQNKNSEPEPEPEIKKKKRIKKKKLKEI